MNDLSNYHSQQDEIASLKKQLEEAKATILKRDRSKKEATASELAARERDIKIAWLLGSGDSVKQVALELNVSAQAVHRVNKLRNK